MTVPQTIRRALEFLRVSWLYGSRPASRWIGAVLGLGLIAVATDAWSLSAAPDRWKLHRGQRVHSASTGDSGGEQPTSVA